jgi:3'-phosphoadenosine 5'-phosphosulfate sulfotransferase (PAPS reductase)/FAD synthetase
MDSQKLEESYDIMRKANQLAIESGTPLMVNFSGGKDSSCLILLAQDIGIKVELIYMETGLEFDGTVNFVKEQAARFDMKLHLTNPLMYQGDFFYWIRKRGYFPGRRYPYCHSRLKLRPSRVYLRTLFGFKHVYRCVDVRKSESARRSKLYSGKEPMHKDTENSGHWLVTPILNWTGDNVKEYMEEKNFPIQTDLYNQFGISQCYWCCYYQKEIYQRVLNVYPDIYNSIIQLEDEIGKPAVAGNIFLHQLRDEFFANKDEIMLKLNSNQPRIKS